MPFPGCRKLWMDGKFIDFEDAKIHVLSHVIHYGSGVFEGERCYNTVKGPAIFRLKDHSRRLLDSAKIYRMTSECNPTKPDGSKMFPPEMFLVIASMRSKKLLWIRSVKTTLIIATSGH